MTRENKLALVVGFALILFVGILISDHFSIARHQPTADLSTAREPALQQSQQESGPQYIAMIAPPSPSPSPSQQQIPAVDTAHVPTEAGRTANGQLVRELVDPISQEQDVQAQQQANAAQQHEVMMLGTTADGRQAAVPIESQLMQAQEDVETPSVRTVNTRTQDADVPQGFEKVQEGAAQPYKFHDVMPGESLYAIVKSEMGDTTKVAEIAKLNKLDDPSMLQVGQRIRIPAPPLIHPTSSSTPGAKTVTAQKVVPMTGTQPVAANDGTATKKQVSPAAKAPAVATYTVQKGDNLSTIASKVLGSKSRWQELYNLNKDVIRSPDNLKVGTKLTLPDRKG
ncbi:MAG TPA: LysM peptidoglycan-binding domain-containing protein [Phycisphaerales bacterium]|nr:LysM peptidoglycan-binding domain-containing protein [Phycisphaerales bacterium]